MANRVLVLAPHPDDESIGCGGALCLHQQRGDAISVVFLTSGERGLPGMAEESVRSLREAEAASAAEVLGVVGLDFLRLPDQGVANYIESGAAQLRTLLAARRPS